MSANGKDTLSLVMAKRACVVRERDLSLERARLAKEASAAGGVMSGVGSFASGALSMAAQLAPYLYVALPAAAGIAAGTTLANATSPTKEDVDMVARAVLKAKKRQAASELAGILESEGPQILDGIKGREVRLG